MKKIFLIVLFITSIAYAHRQHVHQYVTIEAYNLLKLQLGYDITKLYSKLGSSSSWYVGEYAWQRGFITTGAWREDEEDVVYGYSKTSPPTLTGIAGTLYDFSVIFGGISPDGFVSSTHFWYVDDGDNISTTMRAGVRDPFGIDHVVSFTIPNAWQKMLKYADGNWEVLGNTDWLFYVNGKRARLIVASTGQSIRRFYYNNLISLFRNGSVQIKNLANTNYILDVESGQDYYITPSNGTITLYLNDEVRNNTVWEILGRMCHLLQDISVPAHANIDPHGENPGLIDDYYESYFGYNFYWNSQNVYSQIGGMINPYQYQPTNPLHFLMYTTNQMANHFATQGPHKKINNDYFSGNGTSTEIAYLNSLNVSQFGTPTSEIGPFDNNATFNVRDRMLPQAIRATAGLLYWFAKEAGLLPLPLVSVSLMGDFTLYAGGSGHWWVSLENGIEPFTYNWQIMYLDGVGYLQTYESVKKEKEKKDKEKIKDKDGDIIINAAPSNEWVPIGTNSPYFSKPHNPYDLRDFKLRCIVKDATNTTKTSNEFYVDVVSYPPEFSIVQNDYNKDQTISLAKENETASIAGSFALDQNYPNPFNPSTKITYSLTEASFVTLKVFDILGREMVTLVNETKPSGKYEVEFDALELPSGTYIYKLTAGNYQMIRKMLFIK